MTYYRRETAIASVTRLLADLPNQSVFPKNSILAPGSLFIKKLEVSNTISINDVNNNTTETGLLEYICPCFK